MNTPTQTRRTLTVDSRTPLRVPHGGDTPPGAQVHLTALAGTYRQIVTESQDAWAQVGLCGLIASLNPYAPEMWRTRASGRWRMPVAGGHTLSIRLADASMWAATHDEATDAAVVAYAMHSGGGRDPWDGRIQLQEILRGVTLLGASSVDSARECLRWIATERMGFLAGWEQMRGPVHAASELLVRLAETWEGCVHSLLEAAWTASVQREIATPRHIAIMGTPETGNLAPHSQTCGC